MNLKKSTQFVVITLSTWVVCSAIHPASTLASTQNQSNEQKYSLIEIQNALQENLERHYYMFKDPRVRHPEHTVIRVRVLYFTQHTQKVILVGSCLIDGTEHLVTGELGRDKTMADWVFGGGWIQASEVNTPVYWGLGVNQHEAYISGKTSDTSISWLRFTPVTNRRTVVVPVNREGYFAAVVPLPTQNSHTSMMTIQAVNNVGKVVYSTSNAPVKVWGGF